MIPVGVSRGKELDECANAPKFGEDTSSSSSEESLSCSEEVTEPPSERSKSEALSPGLFFVSRDGDERAEESNQCALAVDC